MKKLLLVLLGLTLTFAGCGGLSVQEKEDLIDAIADLDQDELEDLMEDAKYTEVDAEYLTYYVSADYIKEDKLDYEDLEDYDVEDKEGEMFAFVGYDDEVQYVAVYVKEVKDGYVRYAVYVSEDGAELTVSLLDEDEETIVSAYYEYDHEDGELVLDDADSDFDEDDFDDLIDDHEKKAIKFFETAFKELDSVLN